jgi:hypothetical protein
MSFVVASRVVHGHDLRRILVVVVSAAALLKNEREALVL